MFSNQQLNTFSTAPKTATNLRTPHTTIKALKLLTNKHAVKKNKIEKKECISQFWGPSTVCRWPRPTSTPLASGSIQQFGYDSPVSPTNQPVNHQSCPQQYGQFALLKCSCAVCKIYGTAWD